MILQYISAISGKTCILPLVILMLVDMFFSSRIFLKLHEQAESINYDPYEHMPL